MICCYIFLLGLISAWCHGIPTHDQKNLRARDDGIISKQPRPPVPTWPDQFASDFYVYIERYGENFYPKGKVFYDWTKKTFRTDFYDWCLPLFDSGPGPFNNYTCSFLATENNLYFVNHTATTWNNYECCLFADGLGAVAPDWMKIGQYNGTDMIGNISVDVWWFPGSYKQINNPCFGYWSARDSSKRPVQFFGISSLNQTVLQYFSYTPGEISKDINLAKPNAGCDKECTALPMLSQSLGSDSFPIWPQWPTCSP